MKRIDSFAFATVPKHNKISLGDKKEVEILIIEKNRMYSLRRLTKDGFLIVESHHRSIKEAKAQATSESPNLFLDWTEMEGIKDDTAEILDIFKSFKEINISESGDSNIINIGTHKITGFISSERCPSCNMLKIYNDIYDKYFCPRCNVWLESSCGDENCSYCKNSPSTPIPIS